MGRYTIPADVPHSVLDHQPGETFDADLPAEQEARLVARGQITVAGGLGRVPREELDQMASALNIDPAAHPNKQSLIDAIQAHDAPNTGTTGGS